MATLTPDQQGKIDRAWQKTLESTGEALVENESATLPLTMSEMLAGEVLTTTHSIAWPLSLASDGGVDRPTVETYGPLVFWNFNNASDTIFNIERVPGGLLDNSIDIRIAWTKTTDALELGNRVHWKLDYRFIEPGVTEFSTAPQGTIEWEQAYDSSGTTNRRVMLTDPVTISGVQPLTLFAYRIYLAAPTGGPALSNNKPGLVGVSGRFTAYVKNPSP